MRTALLATAAAVTLVTLSPRPAHAEDQISNEKLGTIKHEQDKANAEIEKKYGNRKSAELSPDERRAMAKDKAAAEKEVLEKNGVTAKEYARSSAHVNKDDMAAVDATDKALTKQDAEQANGPKQGGPKEIVIERGNGKGGSSSSTKTTSANKGGDNGEIEIERGGTGANGNANGNGNGEIPIERGNSKGKGGGDSAGGDGDGPKSAGDDAYDAAMKKASSPTKPAGNNNGGHKKH